ncbi:two component transcriptional regulator, winged helix family [Nitratifractor salsuginis DSM 16511]|uniref:Two component transcriptional regulator, winged helix family n=2 Tax=Nitratifractor salsuginis TaxID=269261 RepID=E6WZ99_NITSE|nr:two component transcriptional regulator, winged helix family [Nitratifractor salsuginis DSM 16511]
MKLLLLEDDPIIAEQIRNYFELFDHRVDHYSDGAQLLDEANPAHYDIMLLDINTPGLNGIEVLRSFRDLSIDTPAIFITAMSDLDYLKQAYRFGCNDYVRKPFDIEELEIRIEHLVKGRTERWIAVTERYRFDMKNERLFDGEREVPLGRKERQLLHLLLKNRGHIVSKERIKDYLWEDQEVCDNTLRTTMKKLRDKLEENFIDNLRGVGYRIRHA